MFDIFSLEFFSNIFTTFIGTAFALFFIFLLYIQKKHDDDEVYLKYSIACFVQMHTKLCELKLQEVLKRIEILERYEPGEDLKTLEDSEDLFKKLLLTSVNSIDAEKLNFLAAYDLNAITLISRTKTSYEGVIHSVDLLNSTIDSNNSSNETKLVNIIEKLSEAVDDALYLTRRTAEELIKVCKMHYDDSDIRDFEYTHEKYQDIQPEPIKTFENQEFFLRKEYW